MTTLNAQPEKAHKQSVTPDHKTSKTFTKGDMMEIYRRNSLPGIYAELPFIRMGGCAFIDSSDDIGVVRFLWDCAAGNRCISELDAGNFIFVKADVPSLLFNNKEFSGEFVEWLIYFWKSGDKHHVSEPGKHRPFEAVDLESAGISISYLFSIADGLIDGNERGISG